MCGSNHSHFGELFVVRDVACDVTNHKLCRGNMALSMALRKSQLDDQILINDITV